MRTKAAMFAFLLGLIAGDASAARIYVTTEDPGIGTEDPGTGTKLCSLQEALYSSILHDTLDGTHGIAIDATDQGNPPDHFVTTGCVIGDGNDTIVLPTKGSLTMTGALQPYGYVDGDAYNPYGPTATPLIFSTITIEGNGAKLQWDSSNPRNVRLFAIGLASIKTPNGTAGGTGGLTLRNVHVQGFRAKGGDGATGAGGGLGAGGAIFLQQGSLVVENSTFEGNQAVGGNGAVEDGGFGGGGGLSGNGGISPTAGAGGGGGGARGDGGKSTTVGGGGGGGTVFSGGVADVGGPGGYLCGGNGASDGDGGNGCVGGGGGGGAGGGTSGFFEGSGGDGGYGGGGGGAPNDGGSGGFGGGGGTGGDNGGGGGFGGGGGLGGIFGAVPRGSSGAGGAFGGNGGSDGGGGGGALGGAIFNDSGTVTVRNSTFTNNSVSRGVGMGGGGNGGDAGGAIFSHDGDLTIVNSTFSGNQSTGSGGAVVAYMESDSGIGGPDIFINFTLENTIIANNGANECFYTGNVHAQGTHNLIMSNGSGSQPFGSCADPVVTDDPQLDGLADNGGYTPTMAIPFGSVAMGAADSATSIATDQRGATRPQAGGFDIGAFEVCRIKVGAVFQPAPCSETTQQDPPIILTMLPSTGGATDPAAGDYPEVSNTVVPLKATADSGYYFTGWTGNVASRTSASTTIIMNAPYTVGANFQLHDFSLSADPITLSIPLGGVGSTGVTATAYGNFADKVTLSAAGTPTAVTTSFASNPIAPVAGTPASSIFKFTVGPSARPQIFTETVNGNATGLAGALTRSVSVKVTIIATAAAIVNVIGQEQALGCIDQSGIVQSLNAKMNAYQTLASGGHVQGASNVLTAFQYEVQAQIGHHIVTSCTDSVTGTAFSPGDGLIADAQSLQATLATTVKGAPIVGSVVSTGDAGTAGRTVKLLSGKAVIATASTDAVGFYYLDTSALKVGAQYGVSVTIPKGYKASSPASQTFTWTGKSLQLATFTLN